MISIRKASARGVTCNNWLESYHSFSFANYHEPQYMGFNVLRVINEDTVQPGCGFGKHSHHNMEIITYVIDGTLEHKDSLGTGSVIKPGEIQRMSAGTGIQHSEFNHSKTELLHFLQIWIIPEQQNLAPHYQQQNIKKLANRLLLIASKDKQQDIITIHQDLDLYAAYLNPGHSLEHSLKREQGWLQVIKGKVTLNDHHLLAGDGAAIHENKFEITSVENCELLLFDLGVGII